jgi:hypothetical protein
MPEGNAMTERQIKELEIQIARYRFLEQEVTDPLAACLVHLIILELEANSGSLAGRGTPQRSK